MCYLKSTSISGPGILNSLNVYNLTSTSAVVEWNKPTEINGVLRRYDVWIELQELNPSCLAQKTFKCSLDKCQDIELKASDEVSLMCLLLFFYLCTRIRILHKYQGLLIHETVNKICFVYWLAVKLEFMLQKTHI